MDLFSMLGIETPKEETMKEKKKTGNAKSKTSAKGKKKENEQLYQLPLTVVTGWRSPAKLEGEEKFSDKQLREKIHEMYPEYALNNMAIHVDVKKKCVYVGFRHQHVRAKGVVKLRVDSICQLGSENLDISSVFDGTDEQDVEISDISKVLESTCPIFRNCSLVTGGDILVPVFTQPAFTDSKISFPINILLFGRGTMQVTKQQYAEAFASSGTAWDESDGTVSSATLLDIVVKQWSDLEPKFTVLKYDKEQGMLLVAQQVGEETAKTATSSAEKFPTEGTTLSVIFQKIPLSPDLFAGKKSVTKKELQTYVSSLFPEYSGDNVDFVYNKETNLIVPVLRGSTKGALDMVFSEEEYEQRISDAGLGSVIPFCYVREGVPYRVQCTPVMLTACSMNGDGQGWYALYVPPIPQSILYAVHEFFRQVADEHETEVRVQVYYDSAAGKYVLHVPTQEVTGASVYTTEAEYSKMTETVWPVLDIHSHCRFPAMWSGTDNANELGNWIFGVIGSIGNFVSMKFRIGTGGNFMDLTPDNVFDDSDIDEEEVSNLARMLCAEAEKKLTFVE